VICYRRLEQLLIFLCWFKHTRYRQITIMFLDEIDRERAASYM
jgi:hypothetical protein